MTEPFIAAFEVRAETHATRFSVASPPTPCSWRHVSSAVPHFTVAGEAGTPTEGFEFLSELFLRRRQITSGRRKMISSVASDRLGGLVRSGRAAKGQKVYGRRDGKFADDLPRAGLGARNGLSTVENRLWRNVWRSHGGSPPTPRAEDHLMPTRRAVDSLRPGTVPDLCYGFGRDYSVPMMTRRAFARCGEAWLESRESLPQRLNPYGLSGSRRPPC